MPFPSLLRSRRRFAALVFALALPAALRADIAFTPLGDLPGGSVNSIAKALSADGSTVVGYSSSANGSGGEAFRWTKAAGMTALGDLPGGNFYSQANAVSADGSVVVGLGSAASGFNGAWRWTAGEGLVAVPDLPGGLDNSYAVGVAGDGLTVAAQGSNAANGSEAFRWSSAGGHSPAGFFAGGSTSEALGLSSDGQVLVGKAVRSTGYTAAFRWSSTGGMQDLGYLPGGDSSTANAASSDGSVVVGVSFVANFGRRAFRWTSATGMVDLGLLGPTGTRSEALACSADGSVVVGSSEGGAYGDSAFVWDATNGMRSLKSLVQAAGLAKRWTQFSAATGVSADGTKIAGYGVNGSGNTEAFLIDLAAPPAPPPPPATAGLVWTEDLPQTEPLKANSVVRLAYDNGTGVTDIATLTGGLNGGWGGVEYSGGYLLVPSSANTGTGTRVHAPRYAPVLVTNVKAYDLDFSPGYLWQVNGNAQQILRTIPSGGFSTASGVPDRNWVNSANTAAGRFTNAVQVVGDVVYFSSSVLEPIGIYKTDTAFLAPPVAVYAESGASAPAIYDFEVVGDHIYFGDIANHAIKRVNTDGTGLVTLVSGANFPNSIEVTADAIYWTEHDTRLIRRAKLDGTEVATVRELDNTPRGVAVVPLAFVDGPAPQAVALSGHGSNGPSTVYTGAANAPKSFTATSTSGLPVTVEVVSGPATISGNTITYTGAGAVTLRASQAGNADYAPASLVYYVNAAPRQAQTIDFPALSNLVYAGTPLTFTPSATASSGLTVTFTIVEGSSIASRNSTTGLVTVTGTGTVTIRASQAGNTTYASAFVDRSFTVSDGNTPEPVAQTIAFESIADRVYDSNNLTVSLQATASSGLPVSFSIGSGPASVSGSTLTILGTGDITVIASQAGNASYLPASPVERRFKVTESGGGGGGSETAQTIHFPRPANRLYTGASVTFSPAATASSGLPVSFSVVSGPATFDAGTGLVTLTGTGFVTLRATQPGDGSYDAAEPVEQTFAVTSTTPQAIDVVGAWRLLGEENDEVVVIFNADGTYYLAELGEADDFGESGLEYGTYAWNPVTGLFTVTPSIDQNGEWGLSDTAGSITLLAAGDQLHIEIEGDDDGGHLLARIPASAESALVGAWKAKTPSSELVLIFLPDGTYFQLEQGADDDSGHDGMESGTYTWDPATGALVVTTVFDDNGEWGLSDPVGALTATVSGGTLTVTDDSGSGSATRIDKPSGSGLKSQSIVFDPPAKLAYTTSPVALVATASSKLPVTFEVLEGPATLGEDGKSLLLSGTGRVKVRATQPGNATFSAASRTRDIEIVKGAQTIAFTAPPSSLPLSATPLVLAATASSGLPVSFTVSGPATLAADGVTLSFTGPGAVKIRAEQAGDAIYAAAKPVERVIKVESPELVLGNLLQTYTGSPLAVTVSGAPEGLADSIYVTYSGPGRKKSPDAPVLPGVYNIAVSYGPEGATVKTGKLTIKKAVLTIGVKNTSRFVGSSNPAFELTYDGFVGPDAENETAAIAALAKLPVPSTRANAKSPAGEYEITLSGGSDESYDFRFLKPAGKLSVIGFGGTYEALLRDHSTQLPIGKLTLTVSANSLGYTGTLNLARETGAIIVASTSTSPDTSALVPYEDAAGASATWTRTGSGVDALLLTFNVGADGTLTGALERNSDSVAYLSGRVIHVPAAKQTVSWGGQYSLLLRPGSPAAEGDSLEFPALNGQASAAINSSTGVLSLGGRLADGTPVTASLKPWRIPAETEGQLPQAGYTLWANPYNRAESFLAGALDLAPDQDARRYGITQGALTWTKFMQPLGAPKNDANHGAGFGPLTVPVTLDPWFAPSTKASSVNGVAIPAATLAQRLGLADSAAAAGAFEIAHGPETLDFGNDAEGLPVAASLSATGVVTAASNTTAWKITKIDAAKGTFTGSFALRYTVAAPTASNLEATKVVTKSVTFTGLLRQPANAEDDLLGVGGFLLRSPNDESKQDLPGEILLRRVALP